MRFVSPLRYPGGKARLAPYIATVMSWQDPAPVTYVEPFAGGAGVALRLLLDGDVDQIRINDLNPGIAAFWRSMFADSEAFARRIENDPVDLKAWHEHREVYLNPVDADDGTLGFATFFLNRCNRSGILTARPIGGLEQTGKWLIDARFNRAGLADRVRALGKFADRVVITELDAVAMLSGIDNLDGEAFAYIDPPYLVQGDQLYMNGLSMEDHRRFAKALTELKCRWLLTYDADARIANDLYGDYRCLEFDIRHNAHKHHMGQEFAVFSHDLVVPEDTVVVSGLGRWIRT